MEIFVFDRPVPTKSSESEPSWKKCTCIHRQSQRPKSPPIPTQQSSDSTTRVNTPNRHSSLMQTATLSAYHTGEPQRSSIKSYSLLNETENRFDMQNDAYEFVDNVKKVSYLTGSARCTLVTASALAANNHTHSTNNTTNTSHNSLSSTMSRVRFAKLTRR